MEKKIIYFDNAATSYPKPEEVTQAMFRFSRRSEPARAAPGTAWPSRPAGSSLKPGKEFPSSSE